MLDAGESDMTNASYAQQPAAFLAMVQQFRADLAGLAAQCHGGSPASVPGFVATRHTRGNKNTVRNMKWYMVHIKVKNPSRFILFPL